MAPHDRPREKLERLGPSGLGDNELLALVIGSGLKGQDALDVANRVLAETGGVHALPRTTAGRLRGVRGVGRCRAAQIRAAVELGRRSLTHGTDDRVPLATPRQLAELLLPSFGSHPVEQFGIVMLDTRHRVILTKIVSVGSLDATIVHPREVFREAASASAAAIVLFHNHPSGDPTPSPDDVLLTTRMITAGEIMGIAVLDHVILAEQRYCSLVESGRMRQRAG